MRRQAFVTLLLLAIAVGLLVHALPVAGGSVAYLGPHKVEFLNVQYDTPLDKSTWRFRVTAGPGGTVDGWILGLAGFAKANVSGAYGSWEWKTGSITGVRLTTAIPAGTSKEFWVIMDGNYLTQEQSVGVWSGTNYYTGPTITGPSAAAAPTSTWTPTATATATTTATWTPTSMATDTATPTWTPTTVATGTATATPTGTATPTSTSTPTTTPTLMPTRPFTCTIGPHALTIVRVDYNFPRSGQSRWTYRTIPGGNIERIIFGIGNVGAANVITASRPWEWVPSGSLVGLKIFGSITMPEEIWFDLKGYWDTSQISVAIWSNSQFHSGFCQGPVGPPG